MVYFVGIVMVVVFQARHFYGSFGSSIWLFSVVFYCFLEHGFVPSAGPVSMGVRRFFCFCTVDPLGSLYDPNMGFCVLSSVSGLACVLGCV